MAVGFFVGAVLVLLLGHLAGTNILQLCFWTSVHIRGPAWEWLAPAANVHGYLVELNHAIFYLTVAPAGVFLACTFLQRAGVALETLADAGLLTTPTRPGDPLMAIAAANRRRFRWLLPVLLAAFGLLNLGTEIPAYLYAKRRDAVGYIQGPFLDDWAQRFNDLPPDQQLTRLGAFERVMGSMTVGVQTIVAAYRRQADPAWGAVVRLDGVETPVGSGLAIDDIPTRQLTVDLAAAERAGLFRHRAEAVRPSELGLRFWMFFAGVITLEATFQAIAVGALLKILFWIGAVGRALCGAPDREAVLRPQLHDPRGRYGLGVLDEAYDHVAGMLVIACFVFCLMYVSQSAKGNFLMGRAYPSLGAQALLLGCVSVLLAAMARGPLWRFDRHLDSIRSREVRRLELELVRLPGDAVARPQIEAQLARLEMQTTWPSNDSRFRRLMNIALILLALPILANLGVLPPSWNDYLDLFGKLQGLVIHFSQASCHLPT